jgi:uncharacterized protein YlxW (UPF0749 family)
VRPTTAPASAPPRRVDGSMSLLVDVMTNTLDEGYAERAARRRASEQGPEPPRRSPAGRTTGALVLVLLGLLTGTAVDQVRERADAADRLRGDLAAEVAERSAESDRLADHTAALRAQVAATRDAALEADAAGRRAAQRVRALELASATTAVRGPGIVLTLSDATPGQSAAAAAALRGGTPVEGRVLDRDLQDVVNGLWAAGGEAVAVNGVRLSSRAAIRSAGEAVLVDFRPLSPPYVVEAVGRPGDLEVGFLDGPSGRRLQTLASFSGITYRVQRADELRLPAATEPRLRAAEPVVVPR